MSVLVAWLIGVLVACVLVAAIHVAASPRRRALPHRSDVPAVIPHEDLRMSCLAPDRMAAHSAWQAYAHFLEAWDEALHEDMIFEERKRRRERAAKSDRLRAEREAETRERALQARVEKLRRGELPMVGNNHAGELAQRVWLLEERVGSPPPGTVERLGLPPGAGPHDVSDVQLGPPRMPAPASGAGATTVDLRRAGERVVDWSGREGIRASDGTIRWAPRSLRHVDGSQGWELPDGTVEWLH